MPLVRVQSGGQSWARTSDPPNTAEVHRVGHTRSLSRPTTCSEPPADPDNEPREAQKDDALVVCRWLLATCGRGRKLEVRGRVTDHPSRPCPGFSLGDSDCWYEPISPATS